MRVNTFLITAALSLAIFISSLVYFAGDYFLDGILHSPTHVLRHDPDGTVTFLLLGTGDADHTSPDLTDAIMIVNLHLKKPPSASLLSVPRDLLMINKKQESEGKINSLYAALKSNALRNSPKPTLDEASLQSLEGTKQYFSERLSLPIHYVVKLDFSAFEKAIDLVGGVEIFVPKDIVDYSFPLDNTTVGEWRIGKGMHTLSGKEALRYARSRHSTTDFDRSARQQLIMKAFLTALKQSLLRDPRSLLSLYSLFSAHIVTDLTSDEVIAIARATRILTPDRIIAMQLNFYTGGDVQKPQHAGMLYSPPSALFGSASVLLPVAVSPALDDWSQIRILASYLASHAEYYFDNHSIDIVSSRTAQALELRNELIRYGFSAEVRRHSGETLSDSDAFLCARQISAREFADFLSKEVGIRVSASCPSIDSLSGSVLISLGSRYRFTPIAIQKMQ